MKRIRRILLSLICVIGLTASLGAAAPAAEPTLEDVYAAALEAQRMAQKALDEQAVENIMSRHVLYHCYGEHREEMEEIWVQEPANQATAVFGRNQGYEVGYDYIWQSYVVEHDASWLQSATAWCNENGVDISGMTDEEIIDVYGGVGQLLLHVTTTAIIEVADDGLTAKGYWYTPGMLKQTDFDNADSMWENYGADFIKENGEWKIWHLHMYTDFQTEFGTSFTGSSSSGELGGAPGTTGVGGPPPGGAPGGPSSSADVDTTGWIGGKINQSTYKQWSTRRLRSEMASFPIPLPYESWSFDEPNYGVTVEQYASLGIDVNDWYAAHGVPVSGS